MMIIIIMMIMMIMIIMMMIIMMMMIIITIIIIIIIIITTTTTTIIIIIIIICLTEVPVAVLIEETDGYTMGQRGEERVERTHSLFVDDLKIYQDNYQKLEMVNEMIVKASMDTGACYGVQKCAEIVLRGGTINCRVIPVAGWVMNVCNLGKGDLDELDKTMKCVLRREGFHGRQ